MTHESEHEVTQIASGLAGLAAARARISSGGVASHSRSATTKVAFMNPAPWPTMRAVPLGLRGLFVLCAATIGGRVQADSEDLVISATVGSVTRHVYRGVERSGGAWQIALDGAVRGWRGQFWSNRPFDSAAPGELRSRLGYVWSVAPTFLIEASGTHFWYVDVPVEGEASHSFEADVRLTWIATRFWRWAIESGYDIRFHSRVLEGSLQYDLPLPRWGTYLEGRVYAGHKEAKDVLPDAAVPGVSDGYGYWGADLKLPYRVSWHTTLAVDAHYADTANQNRYWSPLLKGSGRKTWLGLSASYEF